MYKAKDQFFPPVVEGNIKTSGSSVNLGVGEVAFVDISKSTSGGVKILSDFTPLDSSAKLAIRMGEPKDNVSRSEDNKAISSIPFKLKDVVNIYVDAPEREGVLVDDFVIGYNGDEGSELDLDNAENEVIEVCLEGDLMGMIGLPDNKHVARINLTAPIDGTKGTDWTMQEIVEKAYLELENYKLPGNIPITDFIDVILVNSENPATLPGTASTYYTLAVDDEGFQSDLGAVQAQYPTLDVKRLYWESGKSTYSVIGTSLPAAYQPKADFILKGCEDCPAGYTALEQGYVYEIVIEDPTDLTAEVQALPGAEAGSAVLNDTDGDTNTYSVVVDDALTQAEIDAFLSVTQEVTLSGTSGTANLTLNGNDYLATFDSDLATTASDFVTTHAATILATEGVTVTADSGVLTLSFDSLADPSASIANASGDLAGTVADADTKLSTGTVNLVANDVADLCQSATPSSIAWVAGESCNATTETYTITLRDGDCEESRLADLQAAYPDLSITEVDNGSESHAVTISGTSGTATVSIDGTDYVATFDSDLATTAAAFVADHGADIESDEGYKVTSDGAVITFVGDTSIADPTIANTTGDLDGAVETSIAASLCQRKFSTTVVTDLVCEECSPEFRDLFLSEAPESFEGIFWKKAEKSYSADAKMGIRVRGKRAQLGGNELIRDDMFFFDGSVEISLVGGFPTYTNESYLYGTNDRFTVKYFSRKADAQNLGGNLRKYEEEAQMHFRGRSRYVGNNYGKIVNGQESRLEPFKQYAVYSITVAPHKYVSNFQQPQNGAFTYHFILPIGKQEAFEAVVNKLATAAGIPQVQALSK